MGRSSVLLRVDSEGLLLTIDTVCRSIPHSDVLPVLEGVPFRIWSIPASSPQRYKVWIDRKVWLNIRDSMSDSDAARRLNAEIIKK